MKLKRISLRFNLENESDRRAWERLQDLSGSKNKAIISAINGYFEQENNLAETIWLPLGKTPVISAYPKLKKERY